ncbi:MAG TPA: asparagine synthase (glutamine-hydrolyzing) [Chromatiales bacterium]|nr:asparagine synthase (glutamine-hydrolyzing) [Chromatiales bacterium]
MTGLCGWIGTDIPQDNVAETLSRMRSSLPPYGDHWQGEQRSSWGLFTKSNTEGQVSISSSGVAAALSGSPQPPATDIESGSPATMILSAYQRWDAEYLKHIRGSFATAIIKTDQNTAFLAVDRMGIQPLCYSVTRDGGLVFASTVSAVAKHPAVTPEIDYQALYNYVYFHVIPSPKTIYRNIHKLEPGQCLLFRNGSIELNHYWQPEFLDHGGESFDHLKEELMDVLRASVKRNAANGMTGSFLSGGTDSSTVSGMLAEISDSPPPCYSIGFASEGYDEIAYARIAAKHFGNVINEYYVTPDDIVDAIPKIARAYDEPFGNSSAVPTYYCAQLARENGTRLLLAGDGGDELFAGNARYATQKIFDLYQQLPSVLRKGLIEPVFLNLPKPFQVRPLFKVKRYVEQAMAPMPDRMQTYNFLNRMLPSHIFCADFLDQIDIDHPGNELRETYQRAPSTSIINRMLYLDWKLTLADNDLRKVNRMCQLAGVDVSYPMIDDELVDFSTKVPPSLKLKNSKLRYFYKEAIKDFLPKEIITKSKHGFGLPFGLWLQTSKPLQELIYGNLTQLKHRKIIREDFIDQLIGTHLNDHAAYYGEMVWILSMLEQWLSEHGENP